MSVTGTAKGTMVGAWIIAEVIAMLMQSFGFLEFLNKYWGWPLLLACLAFVVLVLYRASIILAAGCFFGALWVWQWPWWGAMLVALPGFAILPLKIGAGMILQSALESPATDGSAAP